MAKLPEQTTSLRTEAIAGVTTFFTMAYIVVVNPAILSTEGTGMSFSGVLTATVLVCFVMTLLMGLYARLPFAVAPGMGINAFFTFTIILGMKVPWQAALGIIFWAGVLFLAISATPVRETIAKAIPPGLRIATAAGLGIFLTFIGLKNAGFIVADPVTFVKLGTLGEDRFTLEHRIFSKQLVEVATEGQGTVVAFHYGRGEKVTLPEELRRRIAELEASVTHP